MQHWSLTKKKRKILQLQTLGKKIEEMDNSSHFTTYNSLNLLFLGFQTV